MPKYQLDRKKIVDFLQLAYFGVLFFIAHTLREKLTMGVRLIPNFQIENGVQLKLTIEEIISLGKENLDFVRKLALTTRIRVSKDNFLETVDQDL